MIVFLEWIFLLTDNVAPSGWKYRVRPFFFLYGQIQSWNTTLCTFRLVTYENHNFKRAIFYRLLPASQDYSERLVAPWLAISPLGSN